MATNKDLQKMVEEGTFREDLYYRLNIFHLELEPIHKNKEKLYESIQHEFRETKKKYQKEHLRLSSEVEGLFLEANWSGNYRELKNCIEYVIALTEGPYVKKSDLPHWFFNQRESEAGGEETKYPTEIPEDFDSAVENFESWYLNIMFNRFEGKVNETARILGISKTTLINKAKKYGINTLQIRASSSLAPRRHAAG